MSRRRQPHRIPPPISYGSEILDSEIVLHEFPDDLGLYLWKSVRTVRLWGEVGDRRSHVFDPEAFARRITQLRALPLDRDLRESLETAASILGGDDVGLETIVTACRHIASWAEARGALGTALEFTQAAALLQPGDAELVHSVAQLARRRGEYARAESWYRQAIATARRTHEWITLATAYLELGRTFLQRGNLPAARQTLIRGVRAATRHSLWEERALLSHELARLAMQTERPAEVVRSGRAALEAYGADHPRLARLAADLGVFWVRSGYPREGVRVLEAVDTSRLDPVERLERAAAFVRAAGASHQPEEVRAAWDDAMLALEEPGVAREAAPALLDLALGAAAAGELDLARKAAERACRAAELRSDGTTREAAEALLRAARGEEPAPSLPSRRAPRELRSLADDLVAMLGSPAQAA